MAANPNDPYDVCIIGSGAAAISLAHRLIGSKLSVVMGDHPMGATRMHTSPAKGVVDQNCCVFGTGNLFVASSSVFPQTGWSNPTLTIVALARRLAEHISRLF